MLSKNRDKKIGGPGEIVEIDESCFGSSKLVNLQMIYKNNNRIYKMQTIIRL